MPEQKMEAGSTLLELAIALFLTGIALAAIKTLESRSIAIYGKAHGSIQQNGFHQNPRNCQREQILGSKLLTCTLSEALKDVPFLIESP